jgi:hypothetical protein
VIASAGRSASTSVIAPSRAGCNGSSPNSEAAPEGGVVGSADDRKRSGGPRRVRSPPRRPVPPHGPR